MTNVLKQIESFIESLFRDETKAQAMIRNPEQTLREAGLHNATPAQFQAVAATAAPSVAMGGGDPVVGLQRAVANHHGIVQETFAPTFQPQRVLHQETQNNFASHNDVASHNIASPTTMVDNSHDLNLSFGDFTLGNKTTAIGDGAVAVGGNNSGDVLSGDGAVKGNGNTVNNGDIRTGDGSPVTLGDHNKVDGESQKVGGDLIQDNKGPVISGVNTGKDGGDGKDDAGHGVIKDPAAAGNNHGDANPAAQHDNTAAHDGATGGDFHFDNSTTVLGNQQNTDIGGDLNGHLDTSNTHVADSFNTDDSLHNVGNTTDSNNEMNSHNDTTHVTGIDGGDILPGV